jgi:hypothetical protein
MSYLVGSIMTNRGDRLYEHLNNLLVLTTTFSISFHVVHFGTIPRYEQAHAQTFYSKQFPRRIYLPMYGIFETALQGLKPNQIEVRIGDERDPDEPGIVPGSFLTLLSNIISPVFVQFFEDHRPWLEDSLPPATWPPILNFGRAVRNAIAHGGNCDIRGRRAQPVRWYHLTYSSATNGHQIINNDLIFADLLLLMFEMSDSLDQLNCPLP